VPELIVDFGIGRVAFPLPLHVLDLNECMNVLSLHETYNYGFPSATPSATSDAAPASTAWTSRGHSKPLHMRRGNKVGIGMVDDVDAISETG